MLGQYRDPSNTRGHPMAPKPAQTRSPGPLRRLAAMVYDLVLMFGMLLLAVTIVVIPYESVTGQQFPQQGALYRIHQVYLAGVFFGFHAFFWVRGGQTLGMRAWRFRLLREDGQPLTAADALKRLVWATVTLAPLGLLWMPFDRERLALHDRLSRTRPVMLRRRV
jgi:uncharacterized RDD family membrane protein YckC